MVQAALSSNTRGGSHGAGATPAAGQGIQPELVDAYSLAVALAPTGCHLSLSLLAAIGEVESGNLAGRRGDAQRRVVPGVLRPVLDGWPYAEIPDTDDGKLDGHKTWDRALGPLQLLPASWRVAGMDADGDGLRDPQNVYDAAGAAMVYLCGHGRDLGTRDGLEATVRAYNHSRDYLRLVLAWKTVFDTADVIGLGSMPTPGSVGGAHPPRACDAPGIRWIQHRAGPAVGPAGGWPEWLFRSGDDHREGPATDSYSHRGPRSRGRPDSEPNGGADSEQPSGRAREAGPEARGKARRARRQAQRQPGRRPDMPAAGRADTERRPPRVTRLLCDDGTHAADRDADSHSGRPEREPL